MLLLACFEVRLQCSDWLKMAKRHLYLKQTIDASHAWAVAKTNLVFFIFLLLLTFASRGTLKSKYNHSRAVKQSSISSQAIDNHGIVGASSLLLRI